MQGASPPNMHSCKQFDDDGIFTLEFNVTTVKPRGRLICPLQRGCPLFRGVKCISTIDSNFGALECVLCREVVYMVSCIGRVL